VDVCRRIARDEDEHRRVFQALSDVLTAGDALRADVTEDDLAAGLEAVDASFVERSRPRHFDRRDRKERRVPRLPPPVRRSRPAT
jgi:hypothetical protein